MSKHLISKFIFILFASIVSMNLVSCSNDENNTINDEKLSITASDEDITTFMNLKGISEPRTNTFQEFNLLSEEEINAQITTSETTDISTKIGGVDPTPLDLTAVGYNNSLEKGNNQIVMITNDLASQLNIAPGYYLVFTAKANKITVWDYKNPLKFIGFSPTTSTEGGYMSSIVENGIASSKGIKHYVSETRYENGKPTTFVMTSHFLYIYSTRSGAKINKWFPCDPLEAKWKFQIIVLL